MKRYITINGKRIALRNKREIKQFWQEYSTWA